VAHRVDLGDADRVPGHIATKRIHLTDVRRAGSARAVERGARLAEWMRARVGRVLPVASSFLRGKLVPAHEEPAIERITGYPSFLGADRIAAQQKSSAIVARRAPAQRAHDQLDLTPLRGLDQAVRERVVGFRIGPKQELPLRTTAGDHIELTGKHLTRQRHPCHRYQDLCHSIAARSHEVSASHVRASAILVRDVRNPAESRTTCRLRRGLVPVSSYDGLFGPTSVGVFPISSTTCCRARRIASGCSRSPRSWGSGLREMTLISLASATCSSCAASPGASAVSEVRPAPRAEDRSEPLGLEGLQLVDERHALASHAAALPADAADVDVPAKQRAEMLSTSAASRMLGPSSSTSVTASRYGDGRCATKITGASPARSSPTRCSSCRWSPGRRPCAREARSCSAGAATFGLLGVVIAVAAPAPDHVTTPDSRDLPYTSGASDTSAEAAPGAGTSYRGSLVDGMQSVLAKHAKSHREQIHYRLSSQYAVNGAFTCPWTRLMDAFIDTARRRSPIRGSMSVHVRSTLFIRMMSVSTDIDDVVAHRISTSRTSIEEETP
jgi:hypothetical protein